VPRGRENEKGKGGSQPADNKDKEGGLDNGNKGGSQKEKAESPQAAAADLVPSMNALNASLAKEIESGRVEVHMEQRGLVVSLHEGGFFPSGDDKVIPGSYSSIAKIAEGLSGLSNPIRLEGHTDSVPIHTDRFSSNWELSASRSIAMMNLLTEKFKVPRERFGIAGYADTAPVDTNKTPEGRARNRRVDIVVLNAKAAEETKSVPTPSAEATKTVPAPAPPAPVAAPQKPSPVPPPAPKAAVKTVAKK
jgi:chemotaxis protein MotB